MNPTKNRASSDYLCIVCGKCSMKSRFKKNNIICGPDIIMFNCNLYSEGRLRTELYDKRDDFNFPIVKFPFIISNIPGAPACSVYISQLIRYSRACGSYQDFLDRGLLLTRQLLDQGFLSVKLKSSLRKLCGRHHDLVDHYGLFVSQMTTDMFHLA
jgi:hypothetical protein